MSLIFTLAMLALVGVLGVLLFREREARLLAEKNARRWRFRFHQTREQLHRYSEELNAAKAQLRRYMGSP